MATIYITDFSKLWADYAHDGFQHLACQHDGPFMSLNIPTHGLGAVISYSELRSGNLEHPTGLEPIPTLFPRVILPPKVQRQFR